MTRSEYVMDEHTLIVERVGDGPVLSAMKITLLRLGACPGCVARLCFRDDEYPTAR
jgi:hypothetical protein